MLARDRRSRMRMVVGSGVLVMVGAAVGLLDGAASTSAPAGAAQSAAAGSQAPSSSSASATVRQPPISSGSKRSGPRTVSAGPSRGSTSGLTDAQARRRTKAAFPQFANDKGWLDLREQPGVDVMRYVGDSSAVVKLGGRRSLVRSLVPLRAGEGKSKRPVDTTLERQGGRLRPEQPLGSYSLGVDTADGSLMAFPNSGVRLSLESAEQSAAVVDGSTVTFPNAFKDADALLKPQPDGAQFAISIRGRLAPEVYAVNLTMRPGDELVATKPDARGPARGPAGGALVLRSGTPVTSITPPTVVDTKGASLPVRTDVNGSTIRYHVGHRGLAVSYPALLDPFVAEDQRYWFGPTSGIPPSTNNNQDFAGWAFTSTPAGDTTGLAGSLFHGRGLNIFSQSNRTYAARAAGTWTFQAPFNPAFEADGARIIKADFGYTAHTRSRNAGSTMVQSIYNRQANAPEGTGKARLQDFNSTYFDYAGCSPLPCSPTSTFGIPVANSEGVAGSPTTYPYRVHCLAICGPTYPAQIQQGLGSPGNQVRLSLVQNPGTNIGGGGGIVYMGSSFIYLAELAGPRITFAGAPSPTAWTKDPFAINATVNDYGLGPEQASVTAPNNTAPLPTAAKTGACAPSQPTGSSATGSANKGDRNNRCTTPLSLQTPSSSLGDGSYNVTVNATDILGNPGSGAVPVKLDRQPPTIALSGSLYDARDGFAGAGSDLSLQVTATDGSVAPATAQRSGVVSVTATLDGQPMTNSPVSAGCTRPEGSCALTLSTSVSTAQLEELSSGSHEIAVTAVDALGQRQTETFSLRIDNIAPATDARGSLNDLQGRVLTDDTYALTIQSTDNAPQLDQTDEDENPLPDFVTPGAGLRDTVIRLDGQSVSTTAAECFDSDVPCGEARTWVWDTTSAANGIHTITVTATDKVGNEDVESFEVDLQRAPPQPSRANDLRQTIVGAAANDRAGTSVAALGDINGDGRADHLIGAPGAAVAGRSAAGAAYVILGKTGTGTTDLAAPDSSVIRFAGPAANSYCGTSVATVGDVNGDDLDDYAIGCPGVNTSDLGSLQPTTGRVFVIFGRTDPAAIDLGNLGNAGFAIIGPQDPATVGAGLPLLASRPSVFGERLQSNPIGVSPGTQDVNGDNLADLVIGDSSAPRAGQTSVGTAYVIYGRTGTTQIDVTNLQGAGFKIEGLQPRGLAGYAAAVIHDANGDTYADVVIGAPGAATGSPGQAFLVYGDQNPTDVDLGNPGTSAIQLNASAAVGPRFGGSVVGLGDTDLDGRDDFAISSSSGAVVVRDEPASGTTLDAGNGYLVRGPANDPGLGLQLPSVPIADAGDIDGDQRSDLIMGYPDAADARAYTVLSPQTSTSINVTTLAGQRGSSNNSGTQGDRSGVAVAANSYQGKTPVSQNAQAIVGAPGTSKGLLGLSAGTVYVLNERNPQGPGVEPDPVGSEPEGTSNPSLRAALTPSRRYVLRTSDDWYTLRHAPNSLTVGSIPGGFEEAPPERNGFMIVTKQTRGTVFGRGGEPSQNFRGCGWFSGKFLEKSDGTSPPNPKCGPSLLRPNTFASLVSCNRCTVGPKVYLKVPPGGIRTYHNIRISKNPNGKDKGVDRIRTITGGFGQPDGAFANLPALGPDGNPIQVRWRYLTKNGNFALVSLSAEDRKAAIRPGLLHRAEILAGREGQHH